MTAQADTKRYVQKDETVYFDKVKNKNMNAGLIHLHQSGLTTEVYLVENAGSKYYIQLFFGYRNNWIATVIEPKKDRSLWHRRLEKISEIIGHPNITENDCSLLYEDPGLNSWTRIYLIQIGDVQHYIRMFADTTYVRSTLEPEITVSLIRLDRRELPEHAAREINKEISRIQKMHKTLVSYEPHTLGYSSARKLWQEGVPESRRVGTDREAHVVLYDEVHTAVRGFSEDPTVLRIVVSTTAPRNLPKGIFWIKPDIQTFTNLIRTLNPGE